MHLVDDIHTVLAGCGSKVDFVTDVAYVFYAIVTCGVNFSNIGNCTVINSAADFTFVTGITVNAVRTVNRLGKNFCTGGFARTS